MSTHGAVGQFMRGVNDLMEGFRWIGRPELRPFVLIPLIINLLLFSGALALGVWQMDALLQQFIPQGWEWLKYIVWPLFFLLVLVVGFYSFTLVANLIGSPFNSVLSARVEYLRQGRFPQGVERKWHQEIALAVVGELRKWRYFLKWILLLLLLGLIPGVNLLTPVFWALLGGWMMAVEYTDYPMGNAGMTLQQQLPWLKARRARALGLGLAVMGASMVPVLNFAVMPAAVVAGTLMWLDEQPPEPPG